VVAAFECGDFGYDTGSAGVCLPQENLMRYDRSFNPEWGYAAPPPSVMRAARLIAFAAIIGATAGAATVFSLVDRPLTEESVAARTLVMPDPVRPLLRLLCSKHWNRSGWGLCQGISQEKAPALRARVTKAGGSARY